MSSREVHIRSRVPNDHEGKKQLWSIPIFSLFFGQLTKFVKELGEVQATLPKSVEKCVKELRSIADGIDTFHKKATIASVVGNSVGIVGRITTIAGIALAPVTFGASLTVTMAGAGVSTAGGITGAASSIADTVNIRKKGKRVEKIIQAVQSDIAHLEELLESSQGAQAAAAVSGVLATLFIFMNIASVAKGAKDLKAGAKAEQAKKIRDVADQMETEFEKIQAAALEVTWVTMDSLTQNRPSLSGRGR
uniref:Uncharacterized protein n=1 Tax=Xenopus tropicalis TaxID=8364 RepID=A0A6I8PZP0_XENTR